MTHYLPLVGFYLLLGYWLSGGAVETRIKVVVTILWLPLGLVILPFELVRKIYQKAMQ